MATTQLSHFHLYSREQPGLVGRFSRQSHISQNDLMGLVWVTWALWPKTPCMPRRVMATTCLGEPNPVGEDHCSEKGGCWSAGHLLPSSSGHPCSLSPLCTLITCNPMALLHWVLAQAPRPVLKQLPLVETQASLSLSVSLCLLGLP